MEDKIEVGEYVRDEDGYIQRLTTFDKQTNIYKDEKGNWRIWEGEDVWGNEYSNLITKHSKNIIDLIQTGDYVNGKRVVYIDTIEDGDGNKRLCVFVEETQDCIEENEIKSVVTHEQYKQIEYIVEE